jgi:hypothetical protein
MLTLLFNALAVLFAASSAPLSLSGASGTSALVQANSAAGLVLQSSSTAVALVQANASGTLVLLSSETASDPIQSIESATLILQGSATAVAQDNADASALLFPNASSGSSALDQAAASAALSLVGSSDAITAIITADGNAALSLSSDSSVHNDSPIVYIGGGSHYQRRRHRKAKPIEQELSAIHVAAAAQLVIVGDSTAQTEAGAQVASVLAISASAVTRRGADPMEAILFLIAA